MADDYQSNPELRMTFADWIEYNFDPQELILNASAVDGSDSPQPHPIGISLYLAEALPRDPRYFAPQATQSLLANAIFLTRTTRGVGNYRASVAVALRRHKWLHPQHIGRGLQAARLPAVQTADIYEKSSFTISPRGRGMDCHRNYEALIYKSIPAIGGCSNNEAMREKYRNLPVIFVPNYRALTKEYLQERYAEVLDTTYDFNILTRSYWEHRRPDVDIVLQSVYWLKRHGKFEGLKRYFKDCDRETIDNTQPDVCAGTP